MNGWTTNNTHWWLLTKLFHFKTETKMYLCLHRMVPATTCHCLHWCDQWSIHSQTQSISDQISDYHRVHYPLFCADAVSNFNHCCGWIKKGGTPQLGQTSPGTKCGPGTLAHWWVTAWELLKASTKFRGNFPNNLLKVPAYWHLFLVESAFLSAY